MTYGACSDESLHQEYADGLRLVATGEIRIVESDSAYVARPSFMSVASSGRFLITDNYFDHVNAVDREGVVVAKVGRQGSGPGELGGAGFSFPLNDSVLVIWDSRSGKLNLFHPESGEFIRQVAFPGVPRDASVSEDAVWVFNGVMVEDVGESLLVAFTGTDTILRVSDDGSILERYGIPHVRRRGVPPDVVERMSSLREWSDLIEVLSSVRALRRLPTGPVAILHYDLTADRQAASAQLFVSLLDLSRRRACVDGEVPTLGEMVPVPAFRGDTLFILDQETDPRTTSIRTSIRSFLVDPSDCDWRELP